MDSPRIALAALATVGSGIMLGLAADPTLRTFPESDWRARYRAFAPAPEPALQPGVSYYGDGSTAWASGGVPIRDDERLPAIDRAVWQEAAPAAMPPPPPAPGDDPPAAYDAASAAARAAAQATVADALARSTPRETATGEPPSAQDADSAAAPGDGGGRTEEGLGG